MLQAKMSVLLSPIPLSEIESVLEWVDGFKLSKPTKKINRDFSDAVLLAEILNVYYPKLVEMHNYPPRNSHALKLNNWMTLNRKVLKKLKLNLCTNTMEQLANAAPGIIERILIMVREKIHRDEEANRTTKDAEQCMSSGGSYYEALDDEDNVLVVPVKSRVSGVLEMVQQKVVTHNAYLLLKEEVKDAKEANEVLKQKIEHLESLIKLKEERIDELQKQLERKASRRKEAEILQNCLGVPFNDNIPITPKASGDTLVQHNSLSKLPVPKNILSNTSMKDVIKVPPNDADLTNVTHQEHKDDMKQIYKNEIKLPSHSELKCTKDNQIILRNEMNFFQKEIKPQSHIEVRRLSQNNIKQPSIHCDLKQQSKNELEFAPGLLKNTEQESKKASLSEMRKMSNEDLGQWSRNDLKKSQNDMKPVVEVNQFPPEISASDIMDDSIVSPDYVKSDIMLDAEQKNSDEDFKDSIQDIPVTIEEAIQNEIKEINSLMANM